MNHTLIYWKFRQLILEFQLTKLMKQAFWNHLEIVAKGVDFLHCCEVKYFTLSEDVLNLLSHSLALNLWRFLLISD